MTALSPFSYQGAAVRVVTDDRGEPWFVAKDVADILGYRDATNAIRGCQDDEKGTRPVSTPGGEQDMLCVTEPGLYRLIFGSQKDDAEAFRRWVLHEVLPAIRKTGSYTGSQRQTPRLPILAQEYRAALALARMAGVVGNAGRISADQVVRKLGYQSPLALLGVDLVNEAQERNITPTEIGKILVTALSARATNELLAAKGLQKRLGDAWVPTTTGEAFAVLLDTGKRHSDGAPVTQLKWRTGVLDRLRLDAQADQVAP